MSSLTPSPRPSHSYHVGDMKTRILGALESRKNTGGEWPIAKELARELGVSETTVRHHLKGLEQQHRVAVFASTLETSCTRVRLVEEAMT